MTRNEDEYLKTCIDSILNTATIPFHIYIVDNSSTSNKQATILEEFEKYNNISIIRNKNNRWILGINSTLREVIKYHSSDYFFLTDGDIDFTNCTARPCWLSYLLNKMENNISLGKVGLSLDWKYLENNLELANVLEQERSLYSDKKKINDLYVSAVDTTAALYRNNWSIENSSLFYPDHMRYLRPELYSCRTPRNITVVHLGWFKYLSNIETNVDSKVKCFALMGADVKPQILQKSRPLIMYFYKIFSKPIKRCWLIRRLFYLVLYFLKKGWRKFDGFGA